MTTYVALLRGINVGGKTLRMEDLRAICAGLGHQDVRTYIQSGNVVFRSPAADAGDLARAIREHSGLEVGVLLRTAAEMAAVAAGNPFLADGASARHLHVTFLDAMPTREAPAGDYRPDEFRIVGREVYLSCPGGYGRTKLHNTFLERRLGVAATTRNWATVERLAAMAAEHG